MQGDKTMKQYRYVLTYDDAKSTKRKEEIYTEFPDERLDELDALGIFWTLEVTTEEAAKSGVWKGLYY
jgi:hypothetical protein